MYQVLSNFYYPWSGPGMEKLKHRTVLILIPALLGCGFLQAQYEPDLLTLGYINSSGEKGLTTFIYNGRDLPYKAIWELADGSRWSVNYHVFDQNGNLIEKRREFSDSLTTHQVFTYNHKGQLVHETFSRSDGTEGEVDYTYMDRLCMTASCRGLNGWFFGEIRYYYDQEGHKDSALLFTGGKQAGRVNYNYDTEERLRMEQWDFNSGFSQTLSYSYLERDCISYRSSNVFIMPSCNRMVKKELYDYNGQGGGPSYYEYDLENRLLHKIFVRSDGLKTVTDYTYLDNGLLKESVRQYNDGQTGTFTYTYNEFGQLTERNFLKSDGATGQEKYSYDKYGKLVSGSYLNFDAWLSGELIFKHNIYDRITEAEFKSINGLNANISFTYGEGAELQKIHWLFENGTTQTYLFFYEL